MQLNNQVRQVHLQAQHTLQVRNNGVWAIFHEGRDLIFPCLEIDIQYALIVRDWFQKKVAVNLYSHSGWKQLFTFNKDAIYFQNNLMYIKQRRVQNLLINNSFYILARNNATMHLLSKTLQSTNQVIPQIDQFINDANFSEIPQHKMFQLEEWAYHGLNQSQTNAVQLVNRQRIAFIKGPPGCGKTKTIARLVTIFSYYKYPMLIGAVTNTANMTILYAILKQAKQMNYMPNVVLFISKQLQTQNMLHPPEVRCHTFRQKLILNYMQLNQNVDLSRADIERLLDQFLNGYKTSKGFISVYYQAMAKTFSQADVVIITTTSAVKLDHKLDEDQRFKPYIGILDQASQASWADSYCFLNKGVQKIVFIGDDKQLTPTVVSQNQVLKETMFNRLYMKNKKYYSLLNVQYRMHPAISQFPNINFYQNQLKDGVSAEQRASSIPYFRKFPTSFINCQSPQCEQIDPRSGKKNYWNQGEIIIVKQILKMFKVQNYKNIGIIAPYDLQIKIMTIYFNNQIKFGLSVKTCDGYQGSQKQYIIVSCVRSNKEGKIGFCNQENRLNVTLTRARRGIVLVGNKKTFLSQTQEPNVWHKYLQYLQQKQRIVQSSCLYQQMESDHYNKKFLCSKSNHTTQKRIKMKIQVLSKDDEIQQKTNKAYKQLKKTCKAIIIKLRASKQKQNKSQKAKVFIQNQKDQQIQQMKQKFKNSICLEIPKQQRNQKQLKVSEQKLKQFEILKQSAKQNINVLEQDIQTKIQQLFGKIEFYVQQQFNHVRQNQIIAQCINLRMLWLLMEQYVY